MSAAPPALSVPLSRDAVPLGTPLEWPVVNADGALLLDAGAVLADEAARSFLFAHFTPWRGDAAPTGPASRTDAATDASSTAHPLTIRDMHLTIGALLGMRARAGSGAPMYPCRVIGFAPNEAVFTTPPLDGGKPVRVDINDNVEIVAIASHAVFRFVCTVESVCHQPFEYVVLSKPGVIRRLRERKSIRVKARLAVRYTRGDRAAHASAPYEGLGIAFGLSASGMSLTTPAKLGEVGTRLSVAFSLTSDGHEMPVATRALIRNLNKSADGGVMHGLEFDELDATQATAMKAYVFDRHDDVMHWTNDGR